MATKKQIAANRRNAKKSTGPRTEGGKDRARWNSLKHGLASVHTVLPHEDPTEYHRIRAELIDTWQAANAQELMLVDQIANGYWRMERAAALKMPCSTRRSPDSSTPTISALAPQTWMTKRSPSPSSTKRTKPASRPSSDTTAAPCPLTTGPSRASARFRTTAFAATPNSNDPQPLPRNWVRSARGGHR